jgi:chorismate dehydratase
MAVRIGAVGYLNARPLTWALDRSPHRWDVRYDVPSVCASLLHSGQVDLGLIPSVEYLYGPDYRLVPEVGIGSTGPVASVALYTQVPVERIRSIALDTSSRTSVALTRVLCHQWFRIAPEFVDHNPDLAGMIARCDAALLIGDPAFDAVHAPLGLEKLDLGEIWTQMTGLPFIYAAWTGRPGLLDRAQVRALQDAQAEGLRNREAIAAEYGRGRPEVAARALAYLSDNVRYGLGPAAAAGLQRFLDAAADLGLAPARRPLQFYEAKAHS